MNIFRALMLFGLMAALSGQKSEAAGTADGSGSPRARHTASIHVDRTKHGHHHHHHHHHKTPPPSGGGSGGTGSGSGGTGGTGSGSGSSGGSSGGSVGAG